MLRKQQVLKEKVPSETTELHSMYHPFPLQRIFFSLCSSTKVMFEDLLLTWNEHIGVQVIIVTMSNGSWLWPPKCWDHDHGIACTKNSSWTLNQASRWQKICKKWCRTNKQECHSQQNVSKDWHHGWIFDPITNLKVKFQQIIQTSRFLVQCPLKYQAVPRS